MNLELDEDRLLFQRSTRRFLERQAPLEKVRQLHDTEHGVDELWWRSAAQLGWTALLVPEADGGASLSGRPLRDAVIVAEERGRMVAAGPFLPVNVVAAGLAAAATSEQKHRYLPGLIDGTSSAGWAFAESDGKWAAAAVTTTASPDGDTIVVNGIKDYVEAGATADVFNVVARTGSGLTQVLIPADSPGVTIERERSLDLTHRFARIRFDGVRVPLSAAVLGQVGSAGDDIERLLQIALTLQSAESVGAMDRVFEFTFAYMRERYAFGRPIASYQALKHRIADLLLQLESAKATTDGAARAVDEAERQAGRLVRVAAAYVGDTAPSFIQECVQLLGGIGVTWEHDIHLYLRRVTLNRAILGTPEHHREEICVRLGVTEAL